MLVLPTEDTEVPRVLCTSTRPEELVSPNSAVRESTRLRNKAANSSKARQEAQKAQPDTEAQSGLLSQSSHQHSIDRHSMPSSAQTDSAQADRVMAAAQAAQQVKHACTIDECELLALRPTLLKGYASLQDNSRSEILEAQLKSLLYYFRHHTVEPEILKKLCFVEIVYMLQNHANRYWTVSVVSDFVCVLFAPVHACCMPGILPAYKRKERHEKKRLHLLASAYSVLRAYCDGQRPF
ncbi:TPA: hypothetical protein ACH3X2_011978 [Trebouxia sp. C0005]